MAAAVDVPVTPATPPDVDPSSVPRPPADGGLSISPAPAPDAARAEPTSIETAKPGWLLVCPVRGDWQLTLLVLGEADKASAEELHTQLTDAITSWPYPR
jgi:hypothetical protein